MSIAGRVRTSTGGLPANIWQNRSFTSPIAQTSGAADQATWGTNLPFASKPAPTPSESFAGAAEEAAATQLRQAIQVVDLPELPFNPSDVVMWRAPKFVLVTPFRRPLLIVDPPALYALVEQITKFGGPAGVVPLAKPPSFQAIDAPKPLPSVEELIKFGEAFIVLRQHPMQVVEAPEFTRFQGEVVDFGATLSVLQVRLPKLQVIEAGEIVRAVEELVRHGGPAGFTPLPRRGPDIVIVDAPIRLLPSELEIVRIALTKEGVVIPPDVPIFSRKLPFSHRGIY